MTKYANVYAGALYELAKEEKLDKKILDDLNYFCSCLNENMDYLKLLSSPALAKEERKALLYEAFSSMFNQYTLNFLCMLCDSLRIREIFNVREVFKERYNVDNNIVEVNVVSATSLSADQRDKLISAIKRKTGKEIVLFEKVDKSLLGGLKLSLCGKEYDGTISYHLGQIAQVLSNN